MSETSDRFELFFDKLKKPSNAIMLLLGLGLLLDLYLGGPAVRQLVTMQMKLFNLDPTAQHFTFHTVFGTFHSIEPVVRNIDLWGGLVLAVPSLLSYAHGLLQSLSIKKIK